MADERIHLKSDEVGYDPVVVAEHVLRYQCVRHLCRGKRVLDVACGEGYGSALLAGWDAAEVVGVDISPDAIAIAKQEFNRENLRFIQGDASRLADVLSNREKFDLIVSFETIEHVPDVPGLLAGIRDFRAPGGTVVISCPNDSIYTGTNPFHMKQYSFEEFRRSATEVLGPADGWLLGTPLLGEVLYPAGDANFEGGGEDTRRVLTSQNELAQAVIVPPRRGTAPHANTCTFYLGYWGAPVLAGAVISPQSHSAFVEPWRALEWFKQQLAQSVEAKAEVDLRLDGLRVAKLASDRQLADLRRRSADLRRRFLAQAQAQQAQQERSVAELHQAQIELQQTRAELQRWISFQESRTYRLMQVYVHSYKLPVVGPVLHGLRRVAGSTLRRKRMV